MLAFSKRPTVSYCPQVYDALSTLDKQFTALLFDDVSCVANRNYIRLDAEY